ncbi:MAG: M48 family metallopeptidase, partial [Deltaproteobacteria bacterium]
GAQLGVLLPYSRTQESEADHIGLLLMARAGYDPRGALAFWQRMERAAGGAPPEFLSTHPSHGTREQQIQAWLPEAMRYYEASAHAGVEPLPAIAGAMARSTPRSDRAHEFFTCNRFRAGVSAPFLVLSFPNDAMG